MNKKFTLGQIQTPTKGQVKRMRLAGHIPVSIQHQGMPTQHYTMETKPLNDFIVQHGQSAIIDFVSEADGVEQRGLVHDVQRESMTQELLHVTFQQVRKNEAIRTHVQLVFHGECAEVRLGSAVASHTLEQLEIECAPDDLPDHISVDMSHLQLGHPLRVADLPRSAKYRILDSPDTVIAVLNSTSKGRGEDAVESGEVPVTA